MLEQRRAFARVASERRGDWELAPRSAVDSDDHRRSGADSTRCSPPIAASVSATVTAPDRSSFRRSGESESSRAALCLLSQFARERRSAIAGVEDLTDLDVGLRLR